MKEDAIRILEEGKLKGFMTQKEQSELTEILKDEFLADRAYIDISGKNADFDDFIGVYLPESCEYIAACRDIRNADLTKTFHNVLDSYIEVCIVNLGWDELIDLFDKPDSGIEFMPGVLHSLNKISIR